MLKRSKHYEDIQKIRDEIIKDLLEKLSMSGLQLKEMIESPIKGTKGNVEYLAEFGVSELCL
jgi:predicted rRNA methylase YqxC with S4 and FtsJ domains